MKTTKKVLAVLLAVLMIALTASCLSVCFTASAVGVGDIIKFGNYPQTKVSETTALKNAANNATWKSYNYYLGTGSVDDGEMYQDDYMQYKDFFLNGVKYRAVKFTKYRPYYTGYTSGADHSYQDDNGYATDTTYYFKYEPLKWRVLDADTGLVLCDSIIDSQAFQNVVWKNGSDYYLAVNSTYYANNSTKSSISHWLNNDFYETAFNAAQQEKVKTTTVTYTAYSSEYSQYNSASANRKMFLLSYEEVQNTAYGFSTSASRQAKGTDYAKCQGLWVNGSGPYRGYSYWRLRSPGSESRYSCNVGYVGGIYDSYYVYYTHIGIRPACVLTNLASDISQSDVHTIGVSADPSGAGTVSGGGAYGKGETVTLSATPNYGYYFCDWYYISNNRKWEVSTNATCTVTVGDADRTYYAEFMPYSYDVTPVASPAAGGSVTGGGTYEYGDSATVKATPSTGYHFLGWYKGSSKVSGDASYRFTVTENVTLTAKFEKDSTPEPTKYTVTANAGAGGSATGGGTFNEGATATVKATPSSGYHFLGWYKGDSKVSGDANYSFTVTENVTLTAKFEKDAAPDNPTQPDNPQPQPDPNMCHWCGKVHTGFFQSIIGFFHNIFAKIFGNKY